MVLIPDTPTHQPWTGDDQQWWDWYVTLAANRPDSGPLGPGPGLPDVPPAGDEEFSVALAEPYPLTDDQRNGFQAESFVKLPGVLPPAVVRRLAERLDALLRAAHGDHNPGRFTALEQMWKDDDVMRRVALSPRLGGIAAGLLGVDVRIYHDNALSKEPGCGRTPWHYDAEHFPLATLAAVTAWIPMSRIPRAMGPLSFARHADLRPLLAGAVSDRSGAATSTDSDTSYDLAVAARFADAGVPIEDRSFEVGEVSFHNALCFHTAGPNRTQQPRRALATTYYADGAHVVDDPTLLSGAWRDFLPGVAPGGLAETVLNPIVGRAGNSWL